MGKRKIIGYVCTKENQFRISLIEYKLLENQSLDITNKKEIFWSKNNSLAEILTEISKNKFSEKISIHNGLRFSNKKGRTVTDGCKTLTKEDFELIDETLNKTQIA